MMEKISFALQIRAQWLWLYFQAHSIIILMDLFLRLVLQKLDISGRIAKWVVELGEFDIHYYPWPSIKAQTLANFLMECILLEEA